MIFAITNRKDNLPGGRNHRIVHFEERRHHPDTMDVLVQLEEACKEKIYLNFHKRTAYRFFLRQVVSDTIKGLSSFLSDICLSLIKSSLNCLAKVIEFKEETTMKIISP